MSKRRTTPNSSQHAEAWRWPYRSLPIQGQAQHKQVEQILIASSDVPALKLGAVASATAPVSPWQRECGGEPADEKRFIAIRKYRFFDVLIFSSGANYPLAGTITTARPYPEQPVLTSSVFPFLRFARSDARAGPNEWTCGSHNICECTPASLGGLPASHPAPSSRHKQPAATPVCLPQCEAIRHSARQIA